MQSEDFPGVPFDGSDLTRPNTQFSSINTRGSNGSSHYNALNVRLPSTNFHNSGRSVRQLHFCAFH